MFNFVFNPAQRRQPNTRGVHQPSPTQTTKHWGEIASLMHAGSSYAAYQTMCRTWFLACIQSGCPSWAIDAGRPKTMQSTKGLLRISDCTCQHWYVADLQLALALFLQQQVHLNVVNCICYAKFSLCEPSRWQDIQAQIHIHPVPTQDRPGLQRYSTTDSLRTLSKMQVNGTLCTKGLSFLSLYSYVKLPIQMKMERYAHRKPRLVTSTSSVPSVKFRRSNPDRGDNIYPIPKSGLVNAIQSTASIYSG